MCSMCDERKKPIADIEPQMSKIVAASSGILAIEAPNIRTSDANTIRAGNPKSNSDNASPIIYVSGETGDATKTSWILYSVL